MFTVEWFFFYPDGITPNSGLTGPNNTIYIYIYFTYSLFKKLFVHIQSKKSRIDYKYIDGEMKDVYKSDGMWTWKNEQTVV